jgi:hypothetical protein
MHILPRAVLVITFLVALPTLVTESETERLPSTSNLPPRKVIVGTSMEAFWVDYRDFRGDWNSWERSSTGWLQSP